eukprot:Pgem_evm1s13708
MTKLMIIAINIVLYNAIISRCSAANINNKDNTVYSSNYAAFGLGYGNVTVIDFIRWLTTLHHCSGGSTCAITNTLDCNEGI